MHAYSKTWLSSWLPGAEALQKKKGGGVVLNSASRGSPTLGSTNSLATQTFT